MNTIAKTIKTLKRQQQNWEKLVAAAGGVSMPGGLSLPGEAAHPEDPGRLEEVREFGSNPGALRMFAYVPRRHASALTGLVVVLHGCTQSAAGYDRGAGWSHLADRYGFALLFPEQQRRNNANGCFNWFQPANTTRGAGEALSIRQMVETMLATHDIDRSRVFVTGLSAGGAMACVMLATYPDVFAAGAVIAGLPYGAAANVQEAFEAMLTGRTRPAREWGDLVRHASPHRGPWPRVSVWQGEADPTVVPANAGEIVKQWLDLHGLPPTPTRDERGKGYAHQIWTDASGEIVVELYRLAGMAHGTPLAPGLGENEAGVAGPFMLDVGLSSTHRIAQFFGLTEDALARAPAPVGASSSTVVAAPELARPQPEPASESQPMDARGRNAKPRRVGAGRPSALNVQEIINKALKAAGLTK